MGNYFYLSIFFLLFSVAANASTPNKTDDFSQVPLLTHAGNNTFGFEHQSFDWSYKPADKNILVQGVPLTGSANGLFFDSNGLLYVANVIGQSISILNPETGEIVNKLGPNQGVFFPDDLTFSPDATLFWTDIVAGSVLSLSQQGQITTVAQNFPSANPITISDDGRVFFAQCFGASNGVFEADPTGVVQPTVLVDNIAGCASNAMDWKDGSLYLTRWFEDRVVKLNLTTGELSNVTTHWPTPAAVKFNSQGILHGISQGNGEVVRIDTETGKRTVLAILPPGLDNLAFDANDRLYVSSSSDAFIVEILDRGEIRVVSPGGLSTPLGLALVGNEIYTGGLQTLRSFDKETGKAIDLVRSVFGIGPLPLMPSVIETINDQHLFLLDTSTGAAAIWNIVAKTAQSINPFMNPTDAEPFMGGLVVSEAGTGNIVKVSGADFNVRHTVFSGLTLPTGIAAYGGNLYVSDSAQGKVLQIVRDGNVLPAAEPVTTATFILPEGIAMRSVSHIVVVEGGTGMLKEIDLLTGKVRVLLENLDFQAAAPGGLPIAFVNDVEVDSLGSVYVNGDGAGLIYKYKE